MKKLSYLAVAALMLPMLLACRPVAAQSAATEPVQPPTFTVQVELREGHLAIAAGSARIDWHDGSARPVFDGCRLSAEAVTAELTGYLQTLFAARPKVLAQLLQTADSPARQRELESLVQTDPLAAELWQGSMPWGEATVKVGRWSQALRSQGSPLVVQDLASVFTALHENNAALADGPLMPKVDVDSPARPRQGLMDFEIAPPLRDLKLRPTANVVQWETLRGGLAEAALADFQCRLWYRPRVQDAMQDYLEVRGLTTSTQLQAKDQAGARELGGVSNAPREHANIRVARPHWLDTQPVARGQPRGVGGRILLEPDPMIAAVYLRGSFASVEQALYMLLPSSDFARVHDHPREHLCAAKAVWLPQSPQPAAIQLPLDDAMPGIEGSALQIAHQYYTRGVLAERLQRLSAIGYQARLAMFHERLAPDADALKARGESPMQRLALLIVEPVAEAADTPPPADLPPCATPRDLPKATPECAGTQSAAASTAAVPACTRQAEAIEATQVDPGPVPATPRQREAMRPARNHVEAGAEFRSGKPVRLSADYRRDGLAPGDSMGLGVGQQREASGSVSYDSDFVGFALLGRRLQLNSRVYSDFTPDRATDSTRPDERRKGVDLRGVLDLWRDRGGSFGQAEFGIARSRAELHHDGGAGDDTSQTTLVDTSLVLQRSQPGTPSSPYTEAELGAARGRTEGEGFGKLRAEASARGLFGRLEFWALHSRWARVTAQAPLTEYLPFGGADSVRGYREEAAVGRRIWSVQGEYWRPLPWQPADEGLARLLRRSLSMAVFADVGAVADSPTGFSGTKAALGLGLRWRYGNALTLQLDAARPVGSVPPGEGRLRLQFGVATLRTL